MSNRVYFMYGRAPRKWPDLQYVLHACPSCRTSPRYCTAEHALLLEEAQNHDLISICGFDPNRTLSCRFMASVGVFWLLRPVFRPFARPAVIPGASSPRLPWIHDRRKHLPILLAAEVSMNGWYIGSYRRARPRQEFVLF